MQILHAEAQSYGRKWTFRYKDGNFILTHFVPFKGETEIEMDVTEWRVFVDFINKVDYDDRPTA